MNEQDQLGALYAVAQEQQAASEKATAVLTKQAETVVHAVKALAAATETLRAQPKAIHQAVVDATADTVRAAVGLAASEATATAQQIAEKAARQFSSATHEAAAKVQEASEKADKAFGELRWWYFLVVFFCGLFVGAFSLYMLRTPAGSPVTLDPTNVAELLKPALIDACKRK